ncbi:hypothetical protein [Lysobacter gummosus]|uniref:Uncharacterized protein n=1 Tax=Lysobacter gummosus TaxID=262324 RepID=A0ABY3X9N2_9GAMM|nr:hypothetical protein [Lysobacter gummosus]UNP29296.1 hypothetical protein MOV92_22970 [Lysobacter gummosus]
MQNVLQRFEEAFTAMPDIQTALIVLFFAFSVVAGNAVFALHYRRVGKPVLRSLFNPTSFPLLNFNTREWLLLLSVAAVSIGIIVLAALSG